MRSYRQLRRFSAWLTSTSLCVSTLALAQPAPPGGADQAGNQGTDPPALAGRVAAMTGAVSFHAAGETQWNAATLNYPVTDGEAFWTEPQAGATLEIADDRLVMDDSTEVDVTALDQNQLAATEAQGAVFLQLNSLPPGQSVSFNTPRGTVQITAVGRYEIVAGDTNDATAITVVEGAAHVSGSNLSLDIGPQQTATIGGTDVMQGSVGPMQPDSFLQAQLNARPRRLASSAPRQVRYMTGAADLQEYGSFTQNVQYGQVWYPNDVGGDWAPYRDGHWAYVQPWGWTWVDNARWGFAPFHYGRWVQVDNRWGWVAGGGEDSVSDYPVYSPALVSFVDVGEAALAGAALGFAAGELAGGYAPAWIPLGPREPYYPWYHCRPDYFGRINTPYGVPRAIVERGPVYNRSVTNIHTVNNFYINRGAATVVPAAAFARGQAIRSIARPLPERLLATASPIVGRLPVRPTAFTPNLSPVVARRFSVVLPRAPIQSSAPGPRVLPVRPGRAAPELRRAALPENVHATPAGQVQARSSENALGGVRQPGQVRPGQGEVPRNGVAGPQMARPGSGLPTLRAPGARPEAVPPGGAITLPSRDSRAPARAADPVSPRVEGTQHSSPVVGQPNRLAEPRVGTGAAAQSALRSATQPRMQEPARLGTSRPAPSILTPRSPQATEAPHPAQRAETPHPAPRPDAARPVARPEITHPASRAEAPQPAPRAEAPRQAPRIETPRSAPRVEAPRPTPRVEAPRPAPRPQAPHPAAPPPRPAAPPPQRPAPSARSAPVKHESPR